MRLVNGAWFVQISLLIQTRWFFHWRKQYYGSWTHILAGSSFCLLKMLTDGLEWCGLLWCFYQLFGLSFWRHPFTAEDPLWAIDVMLHFSKSDEETNSTSWLAWRWVNFQQNFNFGWTIPLIFDNLSAFFWESDLHGKSLVDETLAY